MPMTLTLKNIPDEVYQRLKAAAEIHRRSLNSEAIVCLEMVLAPARIALGERLARARQLRAAPYSGYARLRGHCTRVRQLPVQHDRSIQGGNRGASRRMGVVAPRHAAACFAKPPYDNGSRRRAVSRQRRKPPAPAKRTRPMVDVMGTVNYSRNGGNHRPPFGGLRQGAKPP